MKMKNLNDSRSKKIAIFLDLLVNTNKSHSQLNNNNEIVKHIL